MAEKIGYLARGQGFDVAVFIFRSVDQSRGKGVTEAVETFCFDARGFEDPVESFAEVDGAGNLSVLVGDERAVLAEVEFLAEVFDHFDAVSLRGTSRLLVALLSLPTITSRPLFPVTPSRLETSFTPR